MSDTIKKRHIKLIGGLTADNAYSLRQQLSDTNGVISVVCHEPDHLKVEYELKEINLIEIEKKLGEFDCRISDGLMNRFMRGWIHFIEENEAQNMRSVPKSCCSVPESKQ